MFVTVTTVLSVAGLLVALWAGVLALLRRAGGPSLAIGIVALEVAVLGMAGLAAVLLIQGPRPSEVVTFIGYAVVSLVVLPVAVQWARAEPGRVGNGVLAVGCLTVAVMSVRMGQLWDLPRG